MRTVSLLSLSVVLGFACCAGKPTWEGKSVVEVLAENENRKVSVVEYRLANRFSFTL